MTQNKSTSTQVLDVKDATEHHKVCIMDNKTIRIIGDVSAMSSIEARKLAYALMSAGAQV